MTRQGQYRILFYTACFIVFCIIVKYFAADNTVQANSNVHRPCYATHTCWHNHTYANGQVTQNGTVIATAQPSVTHSKNAATPTVKERKTQTALANSNDPDIQANRQAWDNNEEKRIGASYPSPYATTQGPQTEHATPTDGYNDATPFLVVTSQATSDNAICFIAGCTVEITRLYATNGLSVIAHLPGHDVTVLILQQHNGAYLVSCNNLYKIVTMKQGYTLYVY